MKIVIQRVTQAKVVVDGQTVGKIGPGLLMLLGIDRNDTRESMEKLIAKSLKLKMWPDQDNPRASWAKSVTDMDYELLVVSQFTLHANLKKGNKPDFHNAMQTEAAKEAFSDCVRMYKDLYQPEKIQTGSFGAMMEVSLTNDGPVTFVLE